RAVAAGERDPAAAVGPGHAELRACAIKADYLEIVDPQTFESVDAIAGDELVVLAARVGRVRLIDNLALDDRIDHSNPTEVATPIGAPTIQVAH
ncbi:MAG: pantoate--beta-alanine ligase, partial [Solirubrobacteraceae bacterium]